VSLLNRLSLLLEKINKTEHYEKVKNSYKTIIKKDGDIIAIDLIGIQIESLDKSTFQGFEEIQELYLAWNKMKEIPRRLFNPLENLTVLDLSGNSIERLDTKVFSSLHYLKILHLNDNQLNYIEEELFHPLRGLTELNLRNNSIAVLKPIHFQKLTSLEKFYLYFNPLPEDFADQDYWDKETVEELKNRIIEFYKSTS